MCVSRFVERKGQDMLIRALPLVQRSVPDAALLLVGDGPTRKKLGGWRRELGLREDVVFTGAVRGRTCLPTSRPATCSHADATRKAGFELEGLGIVFLEASATGLPVVAGAREAHRTRCTRVSRGTWSTDSTGCR